jgi:aspartate aminotransferase
MDAHVATQTLPLTHNVAGLMPSATVAINDLSNALRRQGREVFKLGLGQSPFPIPDSVVEALRANAHQRDYLPTQGLWELREVVAHVHCRAFDIDAGPENVLIGPGSKELMFLLQLCYDGDILIPSPSWVSYAPQARIVGHRIVRVDTSHATRWFPTPETLEALCAADPRQPRVLILNHPSNPTGATLERDELVALADVARRYDVVVLSDEIYARTQHAGSHTSIVPIYPEGSILSSGLSKWCGAGGWRLGVFVFPDRLRWLQDAMAAAGTETFTTTSAPIQYAAVRAFEEGPEIEEYLVLSRRILRATGALLYERLRAVGAELVRQAGAFYLFPDFSAQRERFAARGLSTSTELCRRLLEDTGVAVLPGSEFGRPEQELTMRIAYVDFDGREALEVSRAIPPQEELDVAFVHAHCGRVIEAVDRLCEWIGAGPA